MHSRPIDLAQQAARTDVDNWWRHDILLADLDDESDEVEDAVGVERRLAHKQLVQNAPQGPAQKSMWVTSLHQHHQTHN